MNKAVVFDLDGTLLDTLPDIADNVNIALEKFGFNKRGYDEIRLFIGNGARNLITKSMGENATKEQINECLEYYNDIYTNSGSPKTRVFEGVKELVRELKQRGYKIAILTNKPQMTTDDVYETYLKDLAFDKVVGQSALVKCKPDKEAVLSILKEFDVLPQNAYMLGDGDADVLTAINAKMNQVSALWGYRTESELKAVGAKTFINTPLDLLNIIF